MSTCAGPDQLWAEDTQRDNAYLEPHIQLPDDLLVPLPRRPAVLVPLVPLDADAAEPLTEVTVVSERGTQELEEVALDRARRRQRLLRLYDREVLQRQVCVARVASREILRSGGRRGVLAAGGGRGGRGGRGAGLEDRGVVQVPFGGHDSVRARRRETSFNVAVEEDVPVRDDRDRDCLLHRADLVPVRYALRPRPLLRRGLC